MQAFEIGYATGGDEDGIAGQRFGLACARVADDSFAVAQRDALEFGMGHKLNVFADELVLYERGGVGVFARQDVRRISQQCHRAAETLKALC